MKKFLSTILAAIMSLSIATAVSADNNPEVYVDEALIEFADQAAVIKDGRTLVPARGVFEAMGCEVQWDGETRTVRIDSGDNMTRIYLVIDDAVMKIYNFVSIYKADETLKTLDVAPQIINDRTMVPLRAISEAMGCLVEWDSKAYAVYISTVGEVVDAEDVVDTEDKTDEAVDTEDKTDEAVDTEDKTDEAVDTEDKTDEAVDTEDKTDEAVDTEDKTDEVVTDKAAYSLTASAQTVAAGETFDLYINVSNLPADSIVTSVASLIDYNKDDFEFVSATLYANDADVKSTIGGANAKHKYGVKLAYIADEETIAADGVVAKLTFKAVTGNEGSFSFKNVFDSARGYSNILTIKSGEESIKLSGNDLVVSKEAVVVNAQ